MRCRASRRSRLAQEDPRNPRKMGLGEVGVTVAVGLVGRPGAAIGVAVGGGLVA